MGLDVGSCRDVARCIEGLCKVDIECFSPVTGLSVLRPLEKEQTDRFLVGIQEFWDLFL